MYDLTYRPRRLRINPEMRDLVRETTLDVTDLIYPLFIVPGEGIKKEIDTLPGQYHLSVDEALKMAQEVFDLLVVADVCLCQYTTTGHCGMIDDHEILNDETLPLLCKVAVSQAEAGAHMVAPSDMMDGRVGAIREALDAAGYTNVSIMSYAAKYASAYYGPFRGAVNSAPKFGDRKSYQMDPANRLEAFREIELDIAEGADIIMIKPALSYLDIVRETRDRYELPVAVYNVSGEYAMVKSAAAAGLIDEERLVMETMLSMKRAGAKIIITYHAIDIAKWLQK